MFADPQVLGDIIKIYYISLNRVAQIDYFYVCSIVYIQMCSGSSMFVFVFSHDYLLRIDTEYLTLTLTLTLTL